MQKFNSYALNKLKNTLDLFTYVVKLMLGGGIFGLILYFMKIDYYPIGLSFSDSMNFIIISLNFSLIYFLLLICSFSCGFVVNLVFNLFAVISSKEKQIFLLVDFNSLVAREDRKNIFLLFFTKVFYFFVSLLFSLLFFLFYNFELLSVIAFLVSGYGAYLLLSMFYKELSGNTYYGYKGKLILDKKIEKEFKMEAFKFKNKKLLGFLLVGLCMPLLGNFYDIENSRLLFISVKQFTSSHKTKTIFIDKKYIARIPKENIQLKGKQDNEYIKVKNTDILLHGLGKNAWVAFYREDESDKTKQVEIPNDAIYIQNLEILDKVATP